MKKILIIGLAALMVLGLSGIAMAFSTWTDTNVVFINPSEWQVDYTAAGGDILDGTTTTVTTTTDTTNTKFVTAVSPWSGVTGIYSSDTGMIDGSWYFSQTYTEGAGTASTSVMLAGSVYDYDDSFSEGYAAGSFVINGYTASGHDTFTLTDGMGTSAGAYGDLAGSGTIGFDMVDDTGDVSGASGSGSFAINP